jgi:hypothetical protein
MAEYRLGVQLHGHADDVSRRSLPLSPAPPPSLLRHRNPPRPSLLPLQACGDTLGFDPPARPPKSACGGVRFSLAAEAVGSSICWLVADLVQ